MRKVSSEECTVVWHLGILAMDHGGWSIIVKLAAEACNFSS